METMTNAVRIRQQASILPFVLLLMAIALNCPETFAFVPTSAASELQIQPENPMALAGRCHALADFLGRFRMTLQSPSE
jgi:hypothetical protein